MSIATKSQLNVYIPKTLVGYLRDVKSDQGIGSSAFIELLLEYAKKHMSKEEIEQLHEQFLLYGPEGLRKIA